MIYKLKPYSIHELGQRENQEDSIFPRHQSATSKDRLFILCDGMGGHEKGEVASAIVCQTISEYILGRWNQSEPLSDELLNQAINYAYDALDSKDDDAEKKMGTTMTFVCFHKSGVTVAHIGDSRVYQLRPAKNGEAAEIVFRTLDHSLVNDLIRIGEITEEEAKTHPQKNVITRAMQPNQEHRAKADIAHLTDIQPGDYFYMCSDGMLEQTNDENLLYIITKPGSNDNDKVRMLRQVTADNKDNHTAHIIKVDSVRNEDYAQKKKSFFIPILLVLSAIVVAVCIFLPSNEEQKERTTKKHKTHKIYKSKKSSTNKQDVDNTKIIPTEPKEESTNNDNTDKKEETTKDKEQKFTNL